MLGAGETSVASRRSLTIRLLGRVDIAIGERRQTLSARTQLGLVLCVLARRNNERVSTDELGELLWPRERPVSYRNVLQVVISKLRSTLEDSGQELHAELIALDD